MVTMSQRVRVIVLSAILCFSSLLAVNLIIQNVMMSRSSLNKYSRKCPYDLSSSAVWSVYPDDNITGLVASVQDYTSTNAMTVLVFDFSKAQSGMEEIVTRTEKFSSNYSAYDSSKDYFFDKQTTKKRQLYLCPDPLR